MTEIRKYPIGTQDFETLRKEKFLYVDKTEYIYPLVNHGRHLFLARPRRFGKSLFLSTLKAYFLGKKESFHGLAIEKLEKEWIEYPVFHIDFNIGMYTDAHSLFQTLDYNLRVIEEKWGKLEGETNPATRFSYLIQKAHQETGRQVVVLVDEYDKPLLTTIEKATINEEMRNMLKGFYGVLKSSDASLRFVFLTGVTKFSKISIFSDLNQLKDISMTDRYSGICGITQAEMEENFKPEIEALAAKNELSYEATLTKLRKMYDGYHFSKESEDIYNPFSLLNTFDDRTFGNYWFATGTPTFLVKMLKEMDFNIKSLENDVIIPITSVYDYRVENRDPLPLLYQSGYLTIKSYDDEINICTLGFPNDEVKYGFYEELLPVYMESRNPYSLFSTGSFIMHLRANNIDGFMAHLQSFFAGIPYALNNKEEKHYQTIFYIFFTLMGQYAQVEVNSSVGRADAVVVTSSTVYAFEFKISGRGTAKEALQQIDERGYLKPYATSGKKLVKVGVEFDANIRGIAQWEIG